jgi:DNA polymerase-3 subunit gamma/tau
MSMTQTPSTVNNGEYRVLARKYRPDTFADLIGQEAMVQTLSNAIATGRLAHAFILTGVRGVGKTTTARLIAKALNCTGADDKGGVTVDTCGVCENCIAIGQGRHVDVIEMDAASRTGVDDVREIIDSVRYAPVSGRFKVYIIDEVHMLSKNAFNALLKTLEEPPPHMKFIFATTEIRKLPVTVLSRCQRFDLRRVEQDVMVKHLENISTKEGVEIETAALSLIARASEGSVRDGLSLLDQAIAHGGGIVNEAQVRDMLGLADRARILDLFQQVLSGKTADALASFREQYNLGAEPAIVLKDLAEVTHWLTRLKVSPEAGSDTLTSEAEQKLGREMAEKLSMPSLTRAWQLLLKGINEVQTAVSPMAAAEMVLIRLAYAADLPTPADVIKKLQQEPKPEPKQEAASEAKTSAPDTDNNNEGENLSPQTKLASDLIEVDSQAPETFTSGGQVLALKTDESSAPHAEEPSPITFRAMVELFERKKEGILAKILRDDVRVVSFKPQLLAIHPVGRIPVDTSSRVAASLENWTGEKWQVVIEKSGGEQTLAEVDQEIDNGLRAEVAADPLVAKVLEIFPESKIASVTDTTKK